MRDLRELIYKYGEMGAREKFEQLCGRLLSLQHKDLKAVLPFPGDHGIDYFYGEFDKEIHVFQVKFFGPSPLGKVQKNQINTSFNTAVSHLGKRLHTWTLCLPFDLTTQDHNWWSRWRRYRIRKYTFISDIKLATANTIATWLDAPEAASIKEEFFDTEIKRRIRKIDQTIHSNILTIDEIVSESKTEDEPPDGVSFTLPLFRSLEDVIRCVRSPKSNQFALFLSTERAVESGIRPARIIALYDLKEFSSLREITVSIVPSIKPEVQVTINGKDLDLFALQKLLTEVVDKHSIIVSSITDGYKARKENHTYRNIKSKIAIDVDVFREALGKSKLELNEADANKIVTYYLKKYSRIVDVLKPTGWCPYTDAFLEATKWTLAKYMLPCNEKSSFIMEGNDDPRLWDFFLNVILYSSEEAYHFWSEEMLEIWPRDELQKLYERLSKSGAARHLDSSKPDDILKILRETKLGSEMLLSLLVSTVSRDRTKVDNTMDNIATEKEQEAATHPAECIEELMAQIRCQISIPTPIRENLDFWFPIVEQMWDDGIRVVKVSSSGVSSSEEIGPATYENKGVRHLWIPLSWVIRVFDDYIEKTDNK